MAIQYLGTTISGVSGDTKPTLSSNEQGVILLRPILINSINGMEAMIRGMRSLLPLLRLLEGRLLLIVIILLYHQEV